MLQQFTTNSFELYLRTWPRSSAFRRPERHEKAPATKSFMIDDILKRVEPAKKSKEYSELSYIWSGHMPTFSLYQANMDKLDAYAKQASQRKTEVVCPIPKYFRAFLHDSRRFRRTRTVFTRAQLHELEERFEREKYLSTHGRKDFARQLKLTPLQVKTWFQNRRMKWKKEMLRKDPNAVTTRAKGRPKKDEF
ncbi:barH-like 1 homeobox protein [Porites lutea]|uniref:barH-like 1 homeobox protein n=1 Tax=Porites lutea TaxID=51062 RepID=UPI003CC5302C